MTEAQIKAFIAFLESKDFVIAGSVPNRLLGTHTLAPLHPDDLPLLIADAVEELKKQ